MQEFVGDVKLIVVDNLDFSPSNYYIMNAMSQFVFFRTKDRAKAQEAADELYGKGFYTVRTTDLSNKSKSKMQLLADISENTHAEGDDE